MRVEGKKASKVTQIEEGVMVTLLQSVHHFRQAITENQSIWLDASGHWGFKQSIYRFFGGKTDWSSIARTYTQYLDSLEKYPVLFGVGIEEGASQDIHWHSLVDVGYELIQKFDNESSRVAEETAAELHRRLIAIQYRIEEVNGGLNSKKLHFEYLSSLTDYAFEWKEAQPHLNTRKLDTEDLSKLMNLSRYSEFAALLLSHTYLLDEWMEWSIRDRNHVDVFIQYPGLQRKLRDSALQSRIGFFNPDHLRIEKTITSNGDLEKIVTLPFEGHPVNVLDSDSKVFLSGHWTLTVQEVLEVFANKIRSVGDLEYFEDGIRNWNAHKLAIWNAKEEKYHGVQYESEKWWEQLPSLGTLTNEEAQKRYGVPADGVSWITAARSTRGSLNLDFENSHAFIEVAIPIGSGHYRIYDFGKFGTYFPTTFYENLKVFSKVMPAVVAYPDENIFYTHRQTRLYAVMISADKGNRLMDLIRRDIHKGHRGNFVYQIESENCAKWVDLHLRKVAGHLPNIFEMPLIDTEPTGFVGLIFNSFRKLPVSMQTWFITRMHFPFGAWKGEWIIARGKKVFVSLNRHVFWETGIVYLPAFLSKQRDDGVLGSVVRAGRTLEIFADSAVPRAISVLLRKGIQFYKRLITNLFRSDPQLLSSRALSIIKSTHILNNKKLLDCSHC